MNYADIHARALAIWQARELELPERCRRMTPDAFDRETGAWGRVFQLAAIELGWKPDTVISGEG